MKRKIIKTLIILLIIFNILSPILHLAIYGYPNVAAIIADVYDAGVIVVLCIAILHLYNITEDKK